MNKGTSERPAEAHRQQFALLVLVILIGLNLRPFLTAIGPLAQAIDQRLALGMDTLAWLTLLPLWLIGIGVLLTPSLRRRASARQLLGAALLLLGIGSAIRFDAQSGALLIASAALCGLGSALVQGVLPALIKQAFAHKVPLVMGIFSACMMGGGALGASLTPRLAASLDWSRALALWSLPVLLALVWLGWKVRLPRAAAVAIPHGEQRLITLPRSWLLIVCFGIINSGYGIVVAWLAPAYMAQGWSAAQAGELVAWLALAQTASGLGLPLLAARSLDRRPWMGLTIAMQLAGFGGLWLAPASAPILWCMLCGAGLGGSFSLIMVIALDHLPDPRRAGTLSALMQGFGFMLAATGPWVAARLYHYVGDFAAAWQWQLGGLLLMSLLVVRLDPRHYPKVMRLPFHLSDSSEPDSPQPNNGLTVTGEKRPA
ncbi:MFS transporter [Aeromonas sp. YN13HZO-058]|uniref:cyanate transporter n=1 Tax=Aeromonas sp. YN13HZO-058 TaxID=1921564 RepID=UPI000946F133|nr:cyanate transporter [Aeromonas sp. YN13HZO-058]OLF21710.1 MFS transporter [Aeromonas sp. YN13HZO-058]BBT79872.1 MFS transporter [Aeromonas veronii]